MVEGQEVVNKIAHTPTGANDKPRTPVRLVSITFKREGPAPEGTKPAAGAKKSVGTKKSPPAAKK